MEVKVYRKGKKTLLPKYISKVVTNSSHTKLAPHSYYTRIIAIIISMTDNSVSYCLMICALIWVVKGIL